MFTRRWINLSSSFGTYIHEDIWERKETVYACWWGGQQNIPDDQKWASLFIIAIANLESSVASDYLFSLYLYNIHTPIIDFLEQAQRIG